MSISLEFDRLLERPARLRKNKPPPVRFQRVKFAGSHVNALNWRGRNPMNTLYINAALEQLAREGYHAAADDVARLSPLVFEHINLLGRYAFSVPEEVTRGELRPLRNPVEAIEEVA
jgi:hypothetical protein